MSGHSKKLLACAGAALLLAAQAETAQSATRYGQVLTNGQVIFSTGGARTQNGSADCEDGDLVFTFTETVSPERLDFQRLDAGSDDGSGSVSVSVMINEVCFGSGTATFRYQHLADEGEIGKDIDIEPVAPLLVIELVDSASSSVQVNYQVRPRQTDTDDADKRFSLVASQLSFVAGDILGQVGRQAELAAIAISEAPPVDAGVLPDPGGDGGRISASAVAFNNACLDPSAAGSQFLEICRAAQDVEDPDLVAQLLEAFDAHEIAAVTAASSEGLRIQRDNVSSRMAALRSGARGLSIEGVALAFAGNSVDASYLPAEVLDFVNEEGGGGGSSLLSERLGVFVNGNVGLGDRDRRGKEVGFDFDSWGLTAGVDYRFVNDAVAGIAVGYSQYDADVDRDGGSVDSETITIQGYGTYNFTDQFYLDATLGFSGADVDQDRVVDLTGVGGLGRTVARGSTDSTQYSGSLGLNYALPLAPAWDTVLFGQLFYATNDIDGFTETGSPFALQFPDQDFITRTFSAGLRVSQAVSFSTGVLLPFFDASFSHEGGNDGFVFSPALVETGAVAPRIEISNPDRNFGKLDLGASWVFLSGNQLFISYGLLVGESDTAMQTINFGARFEF